MYSPSAPRPYLCVDLPSPHPSRTGPASPRPQLDRRINKSRLTPKEILWRASWPKAFTLILASIMLVFTVIIIALEVANLIIDRSTQLSNTGSTGAGIWSSLSFVIAIVFMYLLGEKKTETLRNVERQKSCCFVLVLRYDSARRWSTFTLCAHFVVLIFIFVLIGLDANAVTPYNNQISSAPAKIQVLKGQLAMAIILILCPLGFIGAYIYTAFVSLFPFRSHTHSVYPPYPVPPQIF